MCRLFHNKWWQKHMSTLHILPTWIFHFFECDGNKVDIVVLYIYMLFIDQGNAHIYFTLCFCGDKKNQMWMWCQSSTTVLLHLQAVCWDQPFSHWKNVVMYKLFYFFKTSFGRAIDSPLISKYFLVKIQKDFLLQMHQSAYRKNHSTETYCAECSWLPITVLVKSDERLVSLISVFDLSTAINILDDSILLERFK